MPPLTLELLLSPKHPYFATVICALAPGMASVYSSLLASDIGRYMLGKTGEYGNWRAKKTGKNLTI